MMMIKVCGRKKRLDAGTCAFDWLLFTMKPCTSNMSVFFTLLLVITRQRDLELASPGLPVAQWLLAFSVIQHFLRGYIITLVMYSHVALPAPLDL